MIVGVPRESFPSEKRVALVPGDIPGLKKAGLDVCVETSAGAAAGYPDELYQEKGAQILEDLSHVISRSDIILQVRAAGANPGKGRSLLESMREGQALIGFLQPFSAVESLQILKEKKLTSFALELIPRITRAQAMDALSSMASIAGYRAALLAADALHKMFPMMITAAGTVAPARVFVIGAGVAGLQAIATSHRLGAVVSAYDIRPAVKDQVQSLGAKFIDLELDTAAAETREGYAKDMGEEFYKRQREMLTRVVAESDAVITTAAIPGKEAPLLITSEMVGAMSAGSVIVDLAAEQGGNCEATKPGESTTLHGIKIIGPLNVPSSLPFHASQLYSKNITTFLLSMITEGRLEPSPEDEIVKSTLLTMGGKVFYKQGLL